MAKIEIKDSPDELGRIACFLQNNNIKFQVVKDYGNHSTQDAEKYTALIEKFEEVTSK
ncbi:hypothetical protein N9954_01425 [Maribacter sp.]|nr:hypothetical protein [Maribacter sp.]